jgi:ankyrin repeat protein
VVRLVPPQLLLQKSVGIERRLLRGRTALMVAAAEGRVEMVELLLSAQGWPAPDLEAVSTEIGETALMLAVRGGHVAVVRRLLGQGASLTAMDVFGRNALHKLASNTHAPGRDEIGRCERPPPLGAPPPRLSLTGATRRAAFCSRPRPT